MTIVTSAPTDLGVERGARFRQAGPNLFFADSGLDDLVMFCISGIHDGAAALGEVLGTLARVDPDDVESWIRAWRELAARVEVSARRAQQAGHSVTARRAFLRAATYHRAAERVLVPPDPRVNEVYLQARSCFREAAGLFDPPIETLDLPFEGGALTGYLARPPGAARKWPTLILVGGSETTAEELWFCGAHGGVERGFVVCFVDLPGQGGTLRLHGQQFRVDTEAPIARIVDHLRARDDVDPDRIAVHGFSGGGYFAPRAAAYEPRIAACIANMPWCSRSAFTETPGTDRARTGAIGAQVAAKTAAGGSQLLEMKFDPRDLTCPTLFLVSTGEQVRAIEHANWFFERVPAPKRMVVFGPETGADTHVQSNNSTLRDAAVFDWLSELWEHTPGDGSRRP